MMMTDPIYGVSDDQDLISSSSDQQASTNPASFLYNLSLLKDKILQVESVATIFLSPDHHPESTAFVIPTLGTLIQEIISTASSMMFSCQQMSLSPLPTTNSTVPAAAETGPSSFFSDPWLYNDQNNNSTEGVCGNAPERKTEPLEENHDIIIELNAADLLAKYTHYCHVCGKGFKRDANLRMHMRAHGDEYKSSAALSNPMKKKNDEREATGERRKYSCPQEGCRWNMRHVKFQPLKSMICVKNHYKRSHCPKMYVCKRCSTKQFSVLSDLRTHEKHCGDVKWICSCGTNFSRKDKLMGHVALFAGHSPAINSFSTTMGNRG